MIISNWEAAGVAPPNRQEGLKLLSALEGMRTDPPFEEHQKRKELITRLRRLMALYEEPRNRMDYSDSLAWRLAHYTERMEEWRHAYEKESWEPPAHLTQP